MNDRPSIGVSVIIIKNNKVLIGKRKGLLGNKTWAFPGGHLEHGESIEECARREANEETGLEISNLRRNEYTNDIFTKERRHYVTLFIVADYKSGKVTNKEPEKCEGWKWVLWKNLPKPRFLPINNLLKKNFTPF